MSQLRSNIDKRTEHSSYAGSDPELLADQTIRGVNDLIDPTAFMSSCMGELSIIIAMADLFKTQVQGDWNELESAHSSHNLQEVRKIAHRLKGAAAYLPAEPLRAAAEQLEKRALFHDQAGIDGAMAAVMRKLGETLNSLDELVARVTALRESR